MDLPSRSRKISLLWTNTKRARFHSSRAERPLPALSAATFRRSREKSVLRRSFTMPEAATTERQGTRVTFLDQTGAKSVDAVIADTVSVKRILPTRW